MFTTLLSSSLKALINLMVSFFLQLEQVTKAQTVFLALAPLSDNVKETGMTVNVVGGKCLPAAVQLWVQYFKIMNPQIVFCCHGVQYPYTHIRV